MTTPHHKNPTQDDRTAFAPYNFVPMTDKVISFATESGQTTLLDVHDQFDLDRFTGWIDIELETKSPLYIRCAFTRDQFAKDQERKADKPDVNNAYPDFFYQDEPSQPVLPGSSLRGMIRSIVEIAAHSKLRPVTNTPLIYRATGDKTNHGDAYRDQLYETDPVQKHHYTPRFHGGYIRKVGREWYIQPAKTVDGTTFARISHGRIPNNLNLWHSSKNASLLYVQTTPYEFQPTKGGFLHFKQAYVSEAASQASKNFRPAVLARSGYMNNKKSELVIYEPDDLLPQDQWIRIPNGKAGEENIVQLYRDSLSPELKKLLGNSGVLNDKQPILYLTEGSKLIFFGHTQTFRLPYPRSPFEMLPDLHQIEDTIDLAEGIFGRVRRTKGSRTAVAGRVFVENGNLLPDQGFPWLTETPISPKILSGPKPTTFQHYVTQSQPNDKNKLHSYNASPRQATLRGHKLYWHKGEVAEQEISADPNEVKKHPSQYTRIRPIRAGVKFQFRIRFENLTDLELGALWWAIAIPVEGEFCHKLGMGKPLGLGSVKLRPTLRVILPKQRYQKLFSNGKFFAGSATFNEKHERNIIARFEQTINQQLGYSSFSASRRIQMLLEMLRWPGPNASKTRYMEIERSIKLARAGLSASTKQQKNRDKVNEYKDRPVLPNP